MRKVRTVILVEHTNMLGSSDRPEMTRGPLRILVIRFEMNLRPHVLLIISEGASNLGLTDHVQR